MSRKTISLTVYITAILLAASVFLPLTRVAIIGDVSYHRIAETEACLVVLLSLSAPALILLEKSRLTLVSVLGVWLVLLFPAIKHRFRPDDGNILSQVSERAAGVMQEFAADLFLNVAEYSWGGYVFLLGLAGFTATGIIKSVKGETG